MERYSPELGSLIRIFSRIEDPRHARGKRYRLIDVFILSVFGLLWGYTDFVNMADELGYHEEYFKEMLGLPYGIPSHDVFSAVYRVIDPQEFLMCFVEWVYEIADLHGRHISIDGKAIRAACDEVHNKHMPYIVNAFLVDQKLVIGQLRVDEKTNEIKGIPDLMDYLDLDGVTITIDAIGCQKEICRKIVQEKNGDYVLPAKENQPALSSMIDGYFKAHLEDYERESLQAEEYRKRKLEISTKLLKDMSYYEESGKDHGRIESRKYYTSTDVSDIEQENWPTAKCIGYTIHERTILHRDEGGEVIREEPTTEINTWIMSRKMSAQEFSEYSRGHWAVENSLHYVLDTSYDEDCCTARKNHSMENLALLRKIVFNLTNLDPVAKGKTKKATMNYFRNRPEAVWDLLMNRIPAHTQDQKAK